MSKRSSNNQVSDGEKSFVIYKVIRTLITSGVTPLPRNYELFYELLSGKNKELAKELLALPHNPDQRLLDKLGEKHQLPGFTGINTKASKANQKDLVTHLSIRLQKTVSRTESIYKSVAQDKQPNPSLLQSLDELRKEHRDLEAYLKEEVARLSNNDKEGDVIAPIATRDTLTGLPNRILFNEKISDFYLDDGKVNNASLILINIDHLRFHNEKFGVSEVNKAICRLAMILKRRLKSHDFVARIGGNEFAVIIADIAQDTAGAIAERLRVSARKIALSPTSRMTLSIGVADNSNTAIPQELFARAELALLASRTGSRDCVTVYGKDVAMRSRQAYLMHLKP